MSYIIHIMEKKTLMCIINSLTWMYKFIVIVYIFLDILSIIWLYFCELYKKTIWLWHKFILPSAFNSDTR